MRLRILKIYIICAFLLLLSGLGYLQLIKGGDYLRTSRRNYIRIIPDEGIRGSIYDTNGLLLTEDYLSLNISVIPQEVKNREKLFHDLAHVLEIDEADLVKSYKKGFASSFIPVVLVPDVSPEKLTKVMERRSYLPGVFIQRIPRRNYVYHQATAHVLGYVDAINTEQFNRLKKYGYNFRDKIGYGGVEEYYDSYLRGESGGRQIQVNNLGRQVKLLGLKKADKGEDLTLTLDARMQVIIHDKFQDIIGSAIFMDPNTGEILAMVSSPAYDPEIFSRTGTKSAVSVLSDRRSPLMNRAISGQYPLGSVFKIVMAMAGLETKTVSPNTSFDCTGRFKLGSASFKCWSTHGRQSIRDAIIHSCNVYFYNLGKLLGVDKIYEYGKKFGLGQRTGIELPSEAQGVLPNPQWKRKALHASWYKGDTINYSIGQGNLLVTPIQVVRIAAAAANGGKLVRPYLVKSISGVDVSKANIKDLGFDSGNIALLRSGLQDVVISTSGSAHYAYSKDFSFAGKTGTAQTSGKAHSWFAGYAPAENPKFALVVMLEHGGSGVYAARMARSILAEFKKQEIY